VYPAKEREQGALNLCLKKALSIPYSHILRERVRTPIRQLFAVSPTPTEMTVSIEGETGSRKD
jgi:hypothetical protein